MIEDLAKIKYRAPSKNSGSSSRLKGGSVIELYMMTVIEAKLDELMNKLGNQDRRMHSAHEVGTMEGNEQKSVTDEGLAHEGPYLPCGGGLVCGWKHKLQFQAQQQTSNPLHTSTEKP